MEKEKNWHLDIRQIAKTTTSTELNGQYTYNYLVSREKRRVRLSMLTGASLIFFGLYLVGVASYMPVIQPVSTQVSLPAYNYLSDTTAQPSQIINFSEAFIRDIFTLDSGSGKYELTHLDASFVDSEHYNQFIQSLIDSGYIENLDSQTYSYAHIDNSKIISTITDKALNTEYQVEVDFTQTIHAKDGIKTMNNKAYLNLSTHADTQKIQIINVIMETN